MKNAKVKLRLLQIGGMFFTFLPIVITVIVNRDVYFSTRSAGWSLGIGGLLAVALVGLSVMGNI